MKETHLASFNANTVGLHFYVQVKCISAEQGASEAFLQIVNYGISLEYMTPTPFPLHRALVLHFRLLPEDCSTPAQREASARSSVQILLVLFSRNEVNSLDTLPGQIHAVIANVL